LGLKIDFHVHTYYSRDSLITPKQLITFAKRAGLDGVAITDHNTIKGVQKIKTKEILVIPGIEISTLEGHLLGINLKNNIPPKLGMKETIQLIHDFGGIAIAPHPTAFYKSPPSKVETMYDAIEVMNASSIPFSVLTYFNQRFANKLNLPETGGSDSHYAPEIGSAYTVIDSDLNVDDIVRAIKFGSTVPVGNAVPWKIRFERAAYGLKKRILID
jgi:predicted metal-dependent phosphoesterase TrpH